MLLCLKSGVSRRDKNMGMYDVITHKIKCPKCKTDIEIEEQIKWTNDCVFLTLLVLRNNLCISLNLSFELYCVLF